MKTILIISVAALSFLATNAYANLISNGDFEQLAHIEGKVGSKTYLDELTVGQWNVYDTLPPDIGGWSTGPGDAGIEIQYSTIDKNDPITGAAANNHYVELDSHGGGTTNSSMFQSFNVGIAQNYTLSFYYRSRTGVAETNGIQVSLDPNGNLPNPLDSIVTNTSTVWQQYSYDLGLLSIGTYKLGFEAIGTDDSYGGFIDNVSVAPVPEPATMLLFGTGLVGLAGARFRRKKK